LSFARTFTPIAITILLALSGIIMSLYITERAIEDSGHEISHHSLSRHLQNLQDFQELLLHDYSEWAEAYEKMTIEGDMTWFHDHIGAADIINTTVHGMAFMKNSGHLAVQFVRDQNPGFKLPPHSLDKEFSHIRNEILKQDANKPSPYSFYHLINGTPALVTLSPLTLLEPEKQAGYDPDQRDFMIFWRLLSPEFLRQVGQSLRFSDLGLTKVQRPENLALKNSLGEPIISLTWRLKNAKSKPLALSLYTSIAMFLLLLVGGYVSYRRVVELLQEMKEAKTKAEKGHQIKSEFLATMSHELRTPLNSIVGFSDILKSGASGPLNERQDEYIEHIQTSSAHLLTIINEILDMSKIEAGKYQLRETEMDLKRVINRCLVYFENAALTKNITLVERLPHDVSDFFGDEKVIKQLLLNLLSNALKFTPENGKITIGGCLTPSGDLKIFVEDNGIGISPEKLDIITEPYLQDQDHKTRHHQGTGLGLAISKAFVELHQGRMSIDSELDVGTTVKVVFPARRLLNDMA